MMPQNRDNLRFVNSIFVKSILDNLLLKINYIEQYNITTIDYFTLSHLTRRLYVM